MSHAVRNPSRTVGCAVRCRCFRSMKKNEEPHLITVVFSNQNDIGIDSFNCSCAAGKGLCQHTIGLLYALNHYQLLGLKSVPPIISKTSLPQVCVKQLFFSFLGKIEFLKWN